MRQRRYGKESTKDRKDAKIETSLIRGPHKKTTQLPINRIVLPIYYSWFLLSTITRINVLIIPVDTDKHLLV